MNDMKTNKTFSKYILLIGLFFSMGSCKKVLEIPLPNTEISGATVFTTTSTTQAAVNGMYSSFLRQTEVAFWLRNLYVMSDEGKVPAPASDLGFLVTAELTAANTSFDIWGYFYRPINRANLLLENLPSLAPGILSDSLKKSYIGAALYVRAVNNFILATTYGDIPLVTSTDLEANSTLSRTKEESVLAEVVKDLQNATNNLPSRVLADSRTIHNRFQPLAYLARVYLYMGNWAAADSASSAVINSNAYQMVAGVNNVFKRGSREAILSLAEVGTSSLALNRTVIGYTTLPSNTAVVQNTYAHLNDSLLRVFETIDQRRVAGNWVLPAFGYNFPNKYLYNVLATTTAVNANPQDYIVQRLAEMYLIRAEARMRLGQITGANSAATDLNMVRNRAGLGNTTASTAAAMMTAIEKERICELFHEGFRWYDLKRWNKMDAVLSALPHKSANYKPHQKLWPIPNSQLLANPNLTQNPGY